MEFVSTDPPRSGPPWPLIAVAAALLTLGGVLLHRGSPVFLAEHTQRRRLTPNEQPHALPPAVEHELAATAAKWEPELFAALGATAGPPSWMPGLKSRCVTSDGARHCVPAAYIIGGWQSGMKRLSQLLKKSRVKEPARLRNRLAQA